MKQPIVCHLRQEWKAGSSRGVDPGRMRAIRKIEEDRPPPRLHGPTSQFVPPSFGRNVSRSFPPVPLVKVWPVLGEVPDIVSDAFF